MSGASEPAGDVLRLENVSAGYGRSTVLRDIDLRVGPGELVALVGANGAGKTTLFRCVTGHLRPSSGAVQLFGASLDGSPPHHVVRAGLGVIPEGRHVFPGLTVEDHLRLAARYGGRLSPRTTAERLEQVYGLFPMLRERTRQLAGQMSGGQQQMLVIARALMTGPRALVLDEPSLGLAPIAVERVFDVLRELHKSGTSVLLIEQNAMAALRMSDRAYVLENGRIRRNGTGEQLAADEDLLAHYVGRLPAAGSKPDGNPQFLAPGTVISPDAPPDPAEATTGTPGPSQETLHRPRSGLPKENQS